MEDQRMTAARFTGLVDAYGGDLARWPADNQAPARNFLRRHPRYARELAAAAELDAALVASRPPPAGPQLAAAIRARRAAVPVPPPVPASVPVLVPLRPSPVVRSVAVRGTPPWAVLAAGLVAFVLGALVGASDGALVSVADPPDAATWIEASISAAAGDIEWEVLR